MKRSNAEMGWNMHKNDLWRAWLQPCLVTLLLILATPLALAAESVESDGSAPPLNLVIWFATEAEATVLRTMGVENARPGTLVSRRGRG